MDGLLGRWKTTLTIYCNDLSDVVFSCCAAKARKAEGAWCDWTEEAEYNIISEAEAGTRKCTNDCDRQCGDSANVSSDMIGAHKVGR